MSFYANIYIQITKLNSIKFKFKKREMHHANRQSTNDLNKADDVMNESFESIRSSFLQGIVGEESSEDFLPQVQEKEKAN